MKRILLSLAGFFAMMIAMADVKLPQLFSSSMVLQRDMKIPVWGWASPGEKVTVQFNKQSKTVKAGKNGKWMLYLNNEAAGGPFQMIVKGKNTITIDDILVGEVWVCSGQSNMEMRVKDSGGDMYGKEIRGATNKEIRHFKVPHLMSDTPVADINAAWKIADDSNNVKDFTSAGYFFALKLQETLHVPVGLINSTWGGTQVEAWMSASGFNALDEFKGVVTKSFADVKASAKDGEMGPNDYPSVLYNGMISPLIPYAIRGTLWYQGEANAGRAAQYAKAFPQMITDWRNLWKQGDFPFYFVQLASWNADNGNSANGSAWAELREAQTATLSLPNTGMAVALDIGNTIDIHPWNKKDVGLRLAAIALDKQYATPGEYSGPMFDTMSVTGNKALLSFSHATGLWVKDNYGYLKGFEVAGSDQHFHYAKAEVSGDKVTVYADSVAAPVAVRYGWADDMPEANLYNKEGFPAVPFRTDNWHSITTDNKYSVK